MKVLKLLLFYVLSEFFVCGKVEPLSRRIINGKKAKPKQFPYFAQIGNYMQVECQHPSVNIYNRFLQAVLVWGEGKITPSTKNKTWEPKINNRVYMNTILLRQDAEIRMIKKIIIHPDFVVEYVDDNPYKEERRLDNDVALGFLDKEYQYSDGITSVTLAPLKPKNEQGDRCTKGIIIGLGWTRYNRMMERRDAKQLMYAEIHTHNRTQLKKPKPKPCFDTKFYSEIPESSKKPRPFIGDSGGPFVCTCNKSSSSHILYGIVSEVFLYNVSNTFISVYESVDKHLDFILTYVKDAKILDRAKPQRSLMLRNKPTNKAKRVASSVLVTLVVLLLVR